MANLKTDFVDDELDVSVNTRRKFRLIDNGDGTVSFEDVTTYLTEGDDYGSAEVNEQNEAINQLNVDLSAETTARQNVDQNLDATKLTNAYYNNASVKQGIAFDKNADNSYFTFRPLLGANTLQLTKSDQSEIIGILSDSSVRISNGTLTVKGQITGNDGADIIGYKVDRPDKRPVNYTTDLLHVTLGNNSAENNKPFYFSTDAGTIANKPTNAPSTWYGWREVHCEMSLTTVVVHEMYPLPGRIWANTYDTNAGTWLGWRCP